jgi:hypothetical protein
LAAAVAATGMPIHDIESDGGEPREGWFALGEDPNAGDDEDDAPVDGPVSDDGGGDHLDGGLVDTGQPYAALVHARAVT